MSENQPSEGIDNLIRNTLTIAHVTLNSGEQRHERHVQYLAYPNDDFVLLNNEINEKRNDRSFEEIYSRDNEVFLRDQSVEVIQIKAQRIYHPLKEFLYPYLYEIEMKYSTHQWTIYRRYKHFHDLHQSLRDFVENQTGKSLSSLNKSDKRNEEEEEELVSSSRLARPCFPTENDRLASIHHFSIEERCKTLQLYLNQVLKHLQFREHPSMREFLEVSSLSFVNGLSESLKEGAICKRSNDDFRGRSIFVRAPFVCDQCKFHHGQKWFVLKDSFLVYLNARTSQIGFPMLIDRTFRIDRGFRKTATNNGIQIKNLQRMMIIKFDKEEQRDRWFQILQETKEKCLYSFPHPFDSFAPKREKQFAQWFINGQSYMEAVAKAILSAKQEIFLTDWWLSPEILLIRPSDQSMRLDRLLGKRAEEGIRIYVMIFKDIVQVVGLNSDHSKRALINSSPTKKNIKVIRHPDHRVLPGTESSFLFSHHEKTIVIDQNLAFIGGIDLCWGRWDTDQHKLIDLHDEENIRELKLPQDIDQNHQEEEKKNELAVETTQKMAQNQGEENINNSIEHSSQTNEQQTSTFHRAKNFLEKIKKKEVADQSSDEENRDEKNVTELSKELNRTEKQILNDENQGEQRPKEHGKKWRRMIEKRKNEDSIENSSDEEEKDEKPRTIIGVTPVLENPSRFFLGKDYSNSYEKDFEFVDQFDQDYIDRKTSPRMPWHDQALLVYGQAARDCARHFIQRWNIHKADKYRYNDFYPYLLPKTLNDLSEFSDLSQLQKIIGEDRQLMEVDAQCVRSCSFWSCGTRTTERSIQNAYLELIDSSQHFIYIENQFFVSIAGDSTIKNGIGDALYRRIIRAHANKEKFRVYIVLPLLPGFSNVNAVQAVLYFIMRSINKGETSLYQRLIQNGVTNPEEFISFYGMRNWDILMGSLVTEIVYVHSKLMIVDDRFCICGSANLNDRSLQGSRDSEFCLVVSDKEMISSTFNGQQIQVGIFSSTWRKKIFRQILGIQNEEINVDDPCSDEFYNYFRSTARKNAQIYEEVFNTLPTNQIRKFDQVGDYVQRPKLKETNPHLAHQKCQQIQGFIVEFPLDFAADDVLMPKWNTSEGMAPILLWT